MRSEPIIPANANNPANQGRRVSAAMRKVDAVIAETQAWLLLALEQMPVRVINAARYEYQVDLAQMQDVVAQIIERMRAATPGMQEAAGGAYAEGTAQASVNLSGLTEDYARPLTSLLSSEPYLRRASLVGARVFEEMQGFAGETGADLARVLLTGIEEGRNPLDVARDIRELFAVSRSRAERIARTEINGALRRGRLDEEQDAQERLGIKTGMLWASALKPTTRPNHASRHGRVYTIDEVRDFYNRDGNGINCFVPGTRVAGRFVAGSKARYEGPVVTLVTAGGNILTVTPNHPVMTEAGMVGAAEISVGDDLISYVDKDENLAGVCDLNGQLVNARIEDVFCSLSDLGHSRRAGVRAVDFHGDGRFMDENVEVVYSEGVLPAAINASIAKCLDDLAFVKSNPSGLRSGALGFGLGSVNLPPACSVGLGDVGKLVFGAREGLPDELCGAHASPLKADGFKVSREAFSGDPVLAAERQDAGPRDVFCVDGREIKQMGFPQSADGLEPGGVKVGGKGFFSNSNRVGDALDALSGLVARDKVVDVVFSHFSGHVYDLQEVSGIMVAQGVILSNCYCAQTSVLLDDDGKPLSTRAIARMTAKREAYQKEMGDG